MSEAVIPGPAGGLDVDATATDIEIITDYTARMLARRCQQFRFKSDEDTTDLVQPDDEEPAHTDDEMSHL